MIEAHNVSTNMGDIFKHVSLPRFDAKDTAHIKLAELVKQAHGQHDGAIRERTVVNVRLAAARLIEREIKRRKKQEVRFKRASALASKGAAHET